MDATDSMTVQVRTIRWSNMIDLEGLGTKGTSAIYHHMAGEEPAAGVDHGDHDAFGEFIHVLSRPTW